MPNRKSAKKRRVKSRKEAEASYVPNEQELKTALEKSTWGKGELSQLLISSYNNIKISYVKAKPYVELFERITLSFAVSHNRISCSSYGELLHAAFFNRAFSNFVASARLMLSCQVTDSFSTLRSCLENGLYAFYTKSDSGLLTVYQNRHTSNEARKEMRRRFQVKDIFECLTSADSRLGQEARQLYNMCIDYGGHPNEWGSIPNIRTTDSGISMVILNADEQFVKGCFCAGIMIGKCVLSIFNLVYPEDFANVNMTLRIQHIEKHFKPVALSTAQMIRYLKS